jgi:hypothetical protein
MIKQTEREHMKEPVHVMKKTHKGEEEVQDEEGEDLSTLADEVTPVTYCHCSLKWPSLPMR